MPIAPANLAWTAFRVPRHGNAADECEDAYAGDAGRGRFAVADGASESAFAAAWAEQLAAGFVAQPGAWSAWLPAARAAWERRFQSAAMPWYVEEKFAQGAYATLLGVAIQPRPGRPDRLRWQARAVGDSCVFQVRDDRLRVAFPTRRSADFDDRPALVGSRPPPPGRRGRRAVCRRGGRAGDVLLLMTDALAQWFLREVEGGGRPWAALIAVEHAEAFAALVAELRDGGRLRNDDTTLLRIRLGEVS